MKQNILLSALLAAILVIAGCGGGGSGSQPSQNNQAAETMARNLHEVLGLLGVNGDVHTTLSSNFEKFNLDDDLGRAVLTKTTETVPGVKPGWTGGKANLFFFIRSFLLGFRGCFSICMWSGSVG